MFTLIGDVRPGETLADVVTERFEHVEVDGNDYYVKVGKLGRADQVGRTAILSEADYPKLVTFRNIRDPRTVEAVDPANLAARFGPGTSLRRITITVTRDPVTKGITKRLGWLNHLKDYLTNPSNPFTDTLPREIGDLRSGI